VKAILLSARVIQHASTGPHADRQEKLCSIRTGCLNCFLDIVDHVPTKKRLWVRRVTGLIAIANLAMVRTAAIFGKRWPWIASTLLWASWGIIHHFFKSDAMPHPIGTKILDV